MELLWGPGDRVELNILENGGKAVNSRGAQSPLPLLLCLVLLAKCGPIVLIWNVSIFPFSVGFFEKHKAIGVSLGSNGQGYQLNILENERKGGHFRGERSPRTFL